MKQSPAVDIGQLIAKEIGADSAKAASHLSLELSAGMVQMRPSDFLAHVQQHWQDPAFRQNLLTRVGPANFLATAREAFGAPPPPKDPVQAVLQPIIDQAQQPPQPADAGPAQPMTPMQPMGGTP